MCNVALRRRRIAEGFSVASGAMPSANCHIHVQKPSQVSIQHTVHLWLIYMTNTEYSCEHCMNSSENHRVDESRVQVCKEVCKEACKEDHYSEPRDVYV
jgi:hypothetical protein